MNECATCKRQCGITINGECQECASETQERWRKKMAIRQAPEQFDMRKLVNLLLTQHWMHECNIIPAYMPPFPHDDTRPRCVVQFTYQDGSMVYLRHSLGPLQGHGWDIYGDDYHSPELALIALSQAPAPPRIDFCIPTHGK